MQRRKALAVPWYGEDKYSRVLAVMADADLLPRTYVEWLYKIERHLQGLVAQGVIVHRVDFDPDAFLAFCTDKNFEADKQAREAFAEALILKHYAP